MSFIILNLLYISLLDNYYDNSQNQREEILSAKISAIRAFDNKELYRLFIWNIVSYQY